MEGQLALKGYVRSGFFALVLFVAAEGENGVETAEGEGVGEGNGGGGFAGFADDDVEVEGGVDGRDASGGREVAVLEGENSGKGLDGSGGSDGMAVEPLGRVDGDLQGARAEDLVDGGGFVLRVCPGSGAVGV